MWQLKSRTEDGKSLIATFAPEQGMNLISYRKGDIEIIDQTTRNLFEERSAGLGALIGPHFHHQADALLPHIPNEALFPHIAKVRAAGVKDPFSHGIARYVPWNFKGTETTLSAHISGRDSWKGIPLSILEGVPFKMSFNAKLSPKGLEITLAVECERASIVGLHYYYALPDGKGVVKALVEDLYNDKGIEKPIPRSWMANGQLAFVLKEPADYGFHPRLEDSCGDVLLQTATHSVQISYQAENTEHSWQLYHPQDASFACIEPLSARNPRAAILPSSSLKVHIEIL